MSHESTELDQLIADLDEQVTESVLPAAAANSWHGCGGDSGLCTLLICNTGLICNG